ncbi:unnamed protein product [Orchesella dallaii]|uniref:Uncharacterized protein n=1 Tax=Orchesella dallaii TaxID=48710 RepID=A0ABP1QD26_9HEXA
MKPMLRGKTSHNERKFARINFARNSLMESSIMNFQKTIATKAGTWFAAITLANVAVMNTAQMMLMDGCGIRDGAPPAGGSCTAPAKGNAVKNYSEDDCPMTSPYLNCCDGQCICCRARNECPVYARRYTECERPARFGEGSGAPKQNGTITE